MSEQTQQLALRQDSWHWRYFTFIRRIWGIKTSPFQISLCPYVQTMIWLTVLTFLLSPLIPLGYLALKASRKFFKVLDALEMHPIITFFEEQTPITRKIEYASEHGVKESPALTLIFTAIAFFSTVIILSSLVGLVVMLAYQVITHIGDLPDLFAAIGSLISTIFAKLYNVILHIGWAFFVIAGVIGFVVDACLRFVHWLFTTGWVWIEILKWIGYIVAGVGISCAAGFGLWKFFESERGKKFIEKLVMAGNGFEKAREEAKARKSSESNEQPKISQLAKLNDKVILGLSYGRDCVINLFTHIFGYTKIVGSTAYNVVTPVTILWHFAIALKKRSCPLMRVVDPKILEVASSVINDTDKYLTPKSSELYDYRRARNYFRDSSDYSMLEPDYIKKKFIDHPNPLYPKLIKYYVAKYLMVHMSAKDVVDALNLVIKEAEKAEEAEIEAMAKEAEEALKRKE